MNWSTVNREDAVKDSFGSGLASGAYTIEIEEAHIFRSRKSDFAQITLKAKVNGSDKYLKLITCSSDGKEGYDSKRVMQLCMLLGVNGSQITELPTDKDNVFAIGQLVGTVGCIIEVKPAISCKPNDEGKQYPEYKVVQFFRHEDGKTLSEHLEKKEAKKVGEIVQKLKEREYKPYKSNTQTTQGYTQSAPSQFDVGSDLTDQDLPF